MSREADYTLKGFIYQFNKTLEQLLSEPDGSEITVEGIVEDIDISAGNHTKAVQCKYHETKDKYSLSAIFKPILQMMVHYSNNQGRNIEYILYAYFPNEKEGIKTVSKTEIENILKTTDNALILSYVTKLKPPLDTTIKNLIAKPRKNADDKKAILAYYKSTSNLQLAVDIDKFLAPDRFRFEIGKSFENLVQEIKNLLESNSKFSKEDVEELFYPNAIQIIADKSIIHDSLNRILEKSSFIDSLEKTKKAVISRWTKELSSYHNLLKKRRLQLQSRLQKNHLSRYFIFSAKDIENFEDEIVNLIIDYLATYSRKVKLHSETPLVCIETSDVKYIQSIESRLYSKGIKFETGFKGTDFFQDAFLRTPKRVLKDEWCEFNLRIGNFSTEIKDAINSKKCDDLFVVGRLDIRDLDLQDVNVEYLDISNFGELRYLLKLSDNIE